MKVISLIEIVNLNLGQSLSNCTTLKIIYILNGISACNTQFVEFSCKKWWGKLSKSFLLNHHLLKKQPSSFSWKV